MQSYLNEEADFEAEMARDEDCENWTDEQWAEFEADQQAASEVWSERHAERQLQIGYAS